MAPTKSPRGQPTSTPPTAGTTTAPATGAPQPPPEGVPSAYRTATDATIGAAVASVMVTRQPPVPGMATIALLGEEPCGAAEEEHLGIVLHPLQFTIEGSHLVGCVVGAFCITAGMAALMFAGRVLCQSCGCDPLEAAAFLRQPGFCLLLTALLYQGSTYAAARLLLQHWNITALRAAVGIAGVVFVVLGFPAALWCGVLRHTPQKLCWESDPWKGTVRDFLLGDGEWCDAHAGHWHLRTGVVVMPYRPTRQGTAVLFQLAETAALSLSYALGRGRLQWCGPLQTVAAVILIVHTVWCVARQPFAKPRDLLYEVATTGCIVAACVVRADSHYVHLKRRKWGATMDAAGKLMLAATIILAAKVAIDALCAMYVNCSGRRVSLQRALDRRLAADAAEDLGPIDQRSWCVNPVFSLPVSTTVPGTPLPVSITGPGTPLPVSTTGLPVSATGQGSPLRISNTGLGGSLLRAPSSGLYHSQRAPRVPSSSELALCAERSPSASLNLHRDPTLNVLNPGSRSLLGEATQLPRTPTTKSLLTPRKPRQSTCSTQLGPTPSKLDDISRSAVLCLYERRGTGPVRGHTSTSPPSLPPRYSAATPLLRPRHRHSTTTLSPTHRATPPLPLLPPLGDPAGAVPPLPRTSRPLLTESPRRHIAKPAAGRHDRVVNYQKYSPQCSPQYPSPSEHLGGGRRLRHHSRTRALSRPRRGAAGGGARPRRPLPDAPVRGGRGTSGGRYTHQRGATQYGTCLRFTQRNQCSWRGYTQ